MLDISLSEDLEAAITKELSGLISEYKESEEFDDLIDSRVQQELDDMFFCFSTAKNGGTLKLLFLQADMAAEKLYDLENNLDEHIDGLYNDNLIFILEGLQRMEKKIKHALST